MHAYRNKRASRGGMELRSATLPDRMSERTEISGDAGLVLDSLETKPALNTPALIAQNEGIEREAAETALAELLAAGRVRQTVMGWKLAR